MNYSILSIFQSVNSHCECTEKNDSLVISVFLFILHKWWATTFTIKVGLQLNWRPIVWSQYCSVFQCLSCQVNQQYNKTPEALFPLQVSFLNLIVSSAIDSRHIAVNLFWLKISLTFTKIIVWLVFNSL